MDPNTVERIANDASRYAVDETTGCWNWLGAKLRGGSGVVRVGQKTQLAYRVFFTFFVGVLLAGVVIHHLCKNSGCVNPRHLEAISKSAHLQLNVEPRGKLSYERAQEIRALWAAGSMTQVALGTRFGVDHSTIWAVVRDKTWREISMAPRSVSDIVA
jgi:hypothetical protein